MTIVATAHSTSLDGFIAGAGDSPTLPLGIGGDRLFRWFSDGDTPRRFYPDFRMSAISAKFFDEGAGAQGAVITGRRTYDIANAWGGRGPLPGVPLFIVTHRIPEIAPDSYPKYTFVTEGVERAVKQAEITADGRSVAIMGASLVQQCLGAGLLDELTIHLVPFVLGRGVRLLDGLESCGVELDLVRIVDAPGVTHLTYHVVK